MQPEPCPCVSYIRFAMAFCDSVPFKMFMFLLIILFFSTLATADESNTHGVIIDLLEKVASDQIRANKPCMIIKREKSIDVPSLGNSTYMSYSGNIGEKTEFVQNLRMVVDKGSFCAIGVTRKFQDLPLLSKVIALADEGALILQTEKETDLENFDTAENQLDREVIAVTRMERESNQTSFTLRMFCPNATLGQTWQVIGFWKEPNGFYGMPNLRHVCPHPFKNNIVKVGAFCLGPEVFCKDGQVTGGTMVFFSRLLAEKFEFNPHFQAVDMTSNFDPNAVPPVMQGIKDGKFHFGHGIPGYEMVYLGAVHETNYVFFLRTLFFARARQPIMNYANIVRPFPPMIWGIVGITFLPMASVLVIFYHVYSKHLQSSVTLSPCISYFDMYLRIFSTLTEPDPIPWFKGWSAGKLLSGLWCVYAMFINMSYQSNLRSHIIAKTYDAPIKTSWDVLARGTNVYVPDINFRIANYDNLGFYHITEGQLEVAKKIRKNNGVFTLGKTKETWIPKYIRDDIIDNGAVAVGEGRNVIILNRREFGRASGYQVSDETIDYVAIKIFLPRDAPWAESIRSSLDQMRDMGLGSRSLFENIGTSKETLDFQEEIKAEKFKLEFFYSIFLFYLAGIVFSIGFFFYEMRTAISNIFSQRVTFEKKKSKFVKSN